MNQFDGITYTLCLILVLSSLRAWWGWWRDRRIRIIMDNFDKFKVRSGSTMTRADARKLAEYAAPRRNLDVVLEYSARPLLAVLLAYWVWVVNI